MKKYIYVFALMTVIAIPAMAAKNIGKSGIKTVCADDVKTLCPNAKKGKETFNCLDTNMDKLSPACNEQVKIKKDNMTKKSDKAKSYANTLKANAETVNSDINTMAK